MRASRPYRSRRGPAAIAAAVGLALTAGLLSAPPATAEPPGPGQPQAAAEADPPAPAEESASAEAARTGVPVPVDELTTETETVVALPDGSLASTRYAGPVRTRQNGAWVDLDPTLVQAGDGTLRPKASTESLTLSGGGTAPLAAMTARGGQDLAVSWPTALPAPVVDGASATYPEVLPGVDLQITATVAGGFSQVLVVKNAQAAQNPQLASLQLGLAADGVTVSKEADGSLAAKSADGAEVFTAPKAVMWDSTATAPAAPQPQAVAGEGAETPDAPPADAVASDTDGPGAYAKVADVEVTPAGSQLSLEPEPGFLTAPDTVFPVYIDPDWAPVWTGTEHWTWVQQGCPGTGNFDDYADQYDMGVGHQRWATCYGIERTYVQVDSFNPTGKIVNFATFNAIQSHAADNTCAHTHGVDLYWTGMISAATTWNNQPANLRSLGRQFSDSAGGAGCPNGTNRIGWDITQLVRDEGWRDNLTFGMRAADESSSSNGFKRYTRKAGPLPHALPFLYVEYNTPPDTPYNQYIWPEPKNAEHGLCGWLGATNDVTGVRMYANIADPDGNTVDAQFHLWDVGVNPPVRPQVTDWVPNPRVASGSQVSAQTLPLLDGHRYNFAVQAGDGTPYPSPHFRGEAGWAWGCPFGVDLTPPSAPVVSSPDWPASGSGQTGKNAGQKGTFTFTATDANNGSGLDMIEYAFNSPLPTVGARGVRDGDDGASDDKVTLKDVRIDTWGTNYLQVRAVDRAGNRSQPTVYIFYAPYDPDRPITLGDITKDSYPDLVHPDKVTGDLKIYPRNAEPGAAGTIASSKANGMDDPAAINDAALRTWNGVLTSHRGGTGVDADDLWAYRPGTPANPGLLSLYLNTATTSGGPTANDGQYFTPAGEQRANVHRPPATQCRPAGQPGACGSNYAADWSRLQQILAVGEIDATGEDRNTYDLITIEDDGTGARSDLWLYHGVGRGALEHPYRLDTTRNWAGHTLATPGDVTGDGVPELWARNTATGNLVQYPLLRTGTEFSLGTGTTIRTGLTSALYPTVSSDGDLYGDTTPDLWGVKPSGEILIWPGRTTAGGSIAFDPPVSPIAGELRLEAEDHIQSGFVNVNCCGYNDWSNDKYAFLGGGTGTFTVNVPAEGDYAIATDFTTAPDYGIVEISVDGQRIGAPFDGYTPNVATRPIPHGTVHLTAGTHTLAYTVTGQNAASTGIRAGVDRIQLTPTTGGPNPVADPGFEAQTSGTLGLPYWVQGRAGTDINQWVNLTTPVAKTGTANAWVHPQTAGWHKLVQPVFVKPNTTYKLTAQIQTGANNNAYFGAMQWNNGPVIAERKLPTTATGYTTYEITFNTGALDRIDIYAGTWHDGADPWLRIDDIKLQTAA